MAKPLAEKMVQPAVQGGLLSYCPTMDLIAMATVDGQTHVFRLNGQKVFGTSSKALQNSINMIRWKPNGKAYDPSDLGPFV